MFANKYAIICEVLWNCAHTKAVYLEYVLNWRAFRKKEPLISLLRPGSVEKWIHCASIMRLLVWASHHGVCGLVYIDLNCQSEYPELSEEHVLTIQHSCTIILFWLTEIWINCFIETAKTSRVFLKLNSAVTPQARFSKNRAVCSFFRSFNLLFHFLMALYKIIKADAVTCSL